MASIKRDLTPLKGPRRHEYFLCWFWVDLAACLPLQCMLVSWAPGVTWWNVGYANRRVNTLFELTRSLHRSLVVVMSTMECLLVASKASGCTNLSKRMRSAPYAPHMPLPDMSLGYAGCSESSPSGGDAEAVHTGLHALKALHSQVRCH